MAKFNPDVPEIQAPNYLGLSKPISMPEPAVDKSGALAIAGAGDLFTSAVTAADDIIKAKIQSRVDTEAGAEKAGYTSALELTKAAITGQEVGPNAGSTKTNATDPSLEVSSQSRKDTLVAQPQQVPSGLDSLSRTLGTLDSARANGKLSETAYYARLNSVARSVRSQFPGYRDYIDSQVEKVTGVAPANAYIKSLIGDINSFVTAKEDRDKQIEALALKNLGVPGMAADYARLRNGDASAANSILEKASKRAIVEEQYKLDNLEMANEKNSVDNRKAKAEQSFSDTTGRAATDSIENIAPVGSMTSAQIQDLVTKSRTNQITLDAEEQRMLGQALRANRDEYIARMQKMARESPVYGLLGPKRINEIINEGAAVHDNISNSIFNKDFGTAHEDANAATAIVDKTYKGLLKEPTLQGHFALMGALRRAGGDQWYSQQFTQEFLRSDLTSGLKTYQKQVAAQAATQPTLSTIGKPIVQKDAIITPDSKEAAIIQDPAAIAKMNDSYIGLTEKIADTRIPEPVRLGWAQFSYKPENIGVLDKFRMDTTDPISGRDIPGKYSVFFRMTNKDVVTQAAALADKYDPKLKGQMRDWAGTEFGTVFRQEIKDLQTLTMTGRLTYNDKTNEFKSAAQPGTSEYKAISRINIGLQGLKNVTAVAGGDVNAYLVQLGIDATRAVGIDPREGYKKSINQFPSAVWEAIKRSQQKNVFGE
jgi:hypothetical protein